MTSNRDKERELEAITKYVSLFGGSFQKLGQTDVGYKIFDKEGMVVGYVEVVKLLRRVTSPYPLNIDVVRLSKLMGKRLGPVIVWSCDDGIVYGPVEKMVASMKFSNGELIAYYEKQKPIKYVRFS
jgi:hypothetical protein